MNSTQYLTKFILSSLFVFPGLRKILFLALIFSLFYFYYFAFGNYVLFAAGLDDS